MSTSLPGEPQPDRYRCPRCLGANVQLAMWVRPNADEVVDTFGSFGECDTTYCDDCEDHTGIVLLCSHCTASVHPGVVIADGDEPQRCDDCSVYESDDAAVEALRTLGITVAVHVDEETRRETWYVPEQDDPACPFVVAARDDDEAVEIRRRP